MNKGKHGRCNYMNIDLDLVRQVKLEYDINKVNDALKDGWFIVMVGQQTMPWFLLGQL